VRDVEDARGAADGEVLGPNALVLHRHLPAGKGDQGRVKSPVLGDERS
jgi:hypothetical protein